MGDFTPHQRNIIRRYYDHRDEIMLARLQEIVTELFLADTDAKRKRLWKRAATAMNGLKLPPAEVERIVGQADPAALARNLRDWIAAARKD